MSPDIQLAPTEIATLRALDTTDRWLTKLGLHDALEDYRPAAIDAALDHLERHGYAIGRQSSSFAEQLYSITARGQAALAEVDRPQQRLGV